jgi:hypothetical protein
MIKRFNVLCHICKQNKPVRYYIVQWQKKYMIPLPWPYCAECVKSRDGLMLYEDWVKFLDAMERVAFRNNAELS